MSVRSDIIFSLRESAKSRLVEDWELADMLEDTQTEIFLMYMPRNDSQNGAAQRIVIEHLNEALKELQKRGIEHLNEALKELQKRGLANYPCGWTHLTAEDD